MAKPTDLVQGTVDLLILRALALQPTRGWGIAHQEQAPCKHPSSAIGLVLDMS
jgi:hypothetical protein